MANELTRAIMANLAGAPPEGGPGERRLSDREERLLSGLAGARDGGTPAERGPASGAITLEELARRQRQGG